MRTTELFCGTKSFSQVMESAGHDTFTVDNEDSFNPSLVIDILNLEPLALPIEPDVLWASPPCEGFSVASIGANWTGGYRGYEPKSDTARNSIALAKKTIEIVKETRPKWWFIENPRGLLRKMTFMEDFLRDSGGTRYTIWYCRYGDSRAKPTDIFTNAKWFIPRPTCHNGNKDHVAAPRGSKTGTQGIHGYKNRSRIPPDLFHDILNQIP